MREYVNQVIFNGNFLLRSVGYLFYDLLLVCIRMCSQCLCSQWSIQNRIESIIEWIGADCLEHVCDLFVVCEPTARAKKIGRVGRNMSIAHCANTTVVHCYHKISVKKNFGVSDDVSKINDHVSWQSVNQWSCLRHWHAPICFP